MRSHVVLSICMLNHCRKHVWQTSGSCAHVERLGKSCTWNESAQTVHSRSVGGGGGEGSFGVRASLRFLPPPLLGRPKGWNEYEVRFFRRKAESLSRQDLQFLKN